MTQDAAINWWAVLAAVASSFVIGGIWYSPALFVKPWLKMSGVDPARFNAGMPKALIGDLIASLLTAFVLAHALLYAGAADLMQGLLTGFWIWLGFMAPVLLATFTYEHKPLKFVAINAGFRLVTILAMAAILMAWR